MPRQLAMQWVGHRTESIYQRYGIYRKKDLSDAADKYVDALTTEFRVEPPPDPSPLAHLVDEQEPDRENDKEDEELTGTLCDLTRYRAVRKALVEGYSTSETDDRPSCFEVASADLVDTAGAGTPNAVRKSYYAVRAGGEEPEPEELETPRSPEEALFD